MGNSGSTLNSEEEWHKYDPNLLEKYSYGDPIAFDRGSYNHWALYVDKDRHGNGCVVHLNPANSSEKVGPLNMNKWFDGLVTKDHLKDVAGNDNIRVVRTKGDSRPTHDIKSLIEITMRHQMFKYCLGQFNCEHFVNFIKYAKPVSGQILVLQVGMTPLMNGRPSLGAGSFSPADILSDVISGSQKEKLKTRPSSTNSREREKQLYEICVNVAEEVVKRPSKEIEKYMFC